MDSTIKRKKFKCLNTKSTEEVSKDQLFDSLIGMLSNDTFVPKKRSYSEELELLAKTLDFVSEAVKDGTITESQANNLLKYLISGIVSKRVSNIFDNIFSKRNEAGFFFANRKQFETKDW